jgi:hypothetical protein
MNLPTYPARPLSGGRLGLMPKPRVHLWSAKLNGWRAPVHTPTGTLWNRQGEELTIAGEFHDALEALSCCRLPWLDCEALERRHHIGQGSLLLIDVMVPEVPANERYRQLLEESVRLGWPLLRLGERPEANRVYLVHQTALSETARNAKLQLDHEWRVMQTMNQQWGAEFYEGFIAKRADSAYPFQLRNPEAHCPWWVKHRWSW